MKYASLTVLLTVLSLVFSVGNLHAAQFTVDTTTDEAGAGFQVCDAAPNNCSLRGAVIKANADAAEDEILIPAGTYTVNIDRVAEAENAGALTETEGDIDIIQSLKLTGDGADDTTVQAAFTDDPNKQDRIFMVNLTAGVVQMSGLTLTGGRGEQGGAAWAFGSSLTVDGCAFTGNQARKDGGALATDNGTDKLVSISSSTFSGNSALNRGGGLFFETATGLITNSTFSGNTVTDPAGAGGAIDVFTSSTDGVTLSHVTVVGNSAPGAGGDGGGVREGPAFAVVKIRNSILAGNTIAGGASENCSGAIESLNHNLSDDASCAFAGTGDQNSVAGTIADATLADNGGPTQTHTLPDASPAIDFVPAADCKDAGGAALTNDQRGSGRPEDGDGDETADCDAGAVEIEAEAGTTGGTTGGTAGTGGETTGGTSGDDSGGGCSLTRQ